MRLFDIAEIDPSLALQKAMVARLKADAKLAALDIGGRVYDAVPPKVTFPFIQVGEDLVNVYDGECTSDTEILSTVRVFSRNLGRVEAKQIAERIRFILTWDSGFEVDDFLMVLGHCEGYQIERHADGLTHQAIIEFRYRLLPLGRRASGGSILPALMAAAAGKLKISASASSVIARPAIAAAGKLRLAAAGAMILPALMSTASATVFSPEMLFAASETGAVYDPSDLTSLYQARTGAVSVTTGGQTVGIMLDKSRMGGKTAAEFIADQPELRGDGTVSTLGAPAPLATYNPSTGEGTSNRVNGSNVSGVAFPVVSGDWYSFDVENFGPNTVTLRSGTVTGAGLESVASGQRRIIAIRAGSSILTLVATGDAMQCAFTLHSLKAIPGFHAIAPSDAARPLYGREPVTGRRNIATYSQDFQNSIWTKGTVAVTPNTEIAPDGTMTAALLTPAGASEFFYNTVTPQAAGNYRFTIWVKSATGSPVTTSLFSNSTGVTPNPSPATPFTATNEWQRIVHPIVSSGAGNIQFGIGGIGSGSNTFAAGENLYVWGAQLEAGTAATPYQKVTAALDVTEAGVATRHFLQPDGVNDWMQVLPVCNLGETWAHVGGWRYDADNDRRLFATSDDYRGAPLSAQTGRLCWINSSDATTRISVNQNLLSAVTIHTIEQQSTSSLSARTNGAGGASIVPWDDSGSPLGLALFSRRNTAWASGLPGRFFGGAWINRSLTTAERRAAEVWQAQRTGVAL